MIEVNDQSPKTKFRVLSSNKPIIEEPIEVSHVEAVQIATPKSLSALKYQKRSMAIKINYLLSEITK